MSIKFLIDVGVGKKVEQWLKENSYNVQIDLVMKRLNPFAKRGDILRITHGYGARSVRLFGSFSRGNATKSSDV